MNNWDDIRFFLAIARAGSVSAAALRLGVNQSTVSRRINAYEDAIKVRLFERLSTGFELTREGEELLTHAQRIEEESFAIERRIMGKNIALSGPIRVTAPLVLVKYLLMPMLKSFSASHPDIELQLDISDNIYNLSQREADVAIRITHEPPSENLAGRELAELRLSVYGSKTYLQSYQQSQHQPPLNWIGEDNNRPRADWLPEGINNLALVMRTNDVLATTEAIKAGVGIGRLPRLIGDNETDLVNVENTPPLQSVKMWILTHSDIRRVSRIKAFISFISDEVRNHLKETDETQGTRCKVPDSI